MAAAGVEPNEVTRKALSLSEEILSKRRTSIVKSWLEQGGDAATAAAWALLNKLTAQGKADVYHFTERLKASHSSEPKYSCCPSLKPCSLSSGPSPRPPCPVLSARAL